ncbi:MAG: SDR family oxidoreductase [Caulobacter sp.]|nr:SDR family oxidoreductase [Caulobacter sp.]
MDLGIAGRSALVCASSAGLGLACAAALAREGCAVTINGRHAARLEKAADVIEGSGGRRPRPVVADLDTAEGRAALLAACPDPDILVTNNGGPAPGRLDQWDHAAWSAALEANLLAPILLIQAVIGGMRARRFGRVVNITSAMVKTPRLPMALSTTARTGLTAFTKALSVEVAGDNVTLNNLMPEKFDTDRLEFMTQQVMKARNADHDSARALLGKSIPARRFGRPEEFGDACAFLCSAQAGYITGQNLQLDGGSYGGLI